MNKELFLDANAHTPLSEAAIKAFLDYNKSRAGSGHPMSPSKPGMEASSNIEEARVKIASLLGAKRAGQIVFTSTCTQAAEWAVNILSSVPSKTGDTYNFSDNAYVSPVEHPSISYCTREWKKLPIDENGVIQKCKTRKAACIHVQNEIGIIQPLENITKDILLVDMCQSVGKVSINLEEMPVDIAIFGGHKFGGSAGVGFMYLRDITWWREYGTGSRYFSERTGTPDVAAVVATAAALEDTVMTMPERLEKMREFQRYIEPRLEELGCEVVAKDAARVPNTTFIRLPKPVAMEVLLELSTEGIFVGLGSACGSLHTGDSPLMKALGSNGGADDFIRISQHGYYGKQDASLFIDKMQIIMKRK